MGDAHVRLLRHEGGPPPTACQGKQDLARCNDNQCATQENVDNDSACGISVLANDCGPYLPIFCTGQPTQTPR